MTHIIRRVGRGTINQYNARSQALYVPSEFMRRNQRYIQARDVLGNAKGGDRDDDSIRQRIAFMEDALRSEHVLPEHRDRAIWTINNLQSQLGAGWQGQPE